MTPTLYSHLADVFYETVKTDVDQLYPEQKMSIQTTRATEIEFSNAGYVKRFRQEITPHPSRLCSALFLPVTAAN